MRPELRSVSGLRVPDVGCGTSVPGRHRAAPHVASGCLLPASTPGKSRIMGRPLTHRHTNPIQARSLRHAFPPCLCPPLPPGQAFSQHLLAPPPLLWGAESPFPRAASSPVSRQVSVPTRQRAGKACPQAALPSEVSALHAASWQRVHAAGDLKAQRAVPSLACSFLEPPDRRAAEAQPVTSLQGPGSSAGIFFKRLFF